MKKVFLFIFCFILLHNVRGQVNCISNLKFAADSFDVFIVAVTPENLKQFSILENTTKLPHQSFVEKFDTDSSLFLINASICDSSCNPLGYLKNNGVEAYPINLNDGKGNFYLKPNGALLLTKDDALIVESSFVSTINNVTLGVQSGPLLLNNGIVNPSFTSTSQNKKTRCGVGVFIDSKGEKKLVFIKSINPVSFYSFTMVFQKHFGCDVALCLESSGCAMNLPYLKDTNFDVKNSVVCRYILFK